MNCTSTNRFR